MSRNILQETQLLRLIYTQLQKLKTGLSIAETTQATREAIETAANLDEIEPKLDGIIQAIAAYGGGLDAAQVTSAIEAATNLDGIESLLNQIELNTAAGSGGGGGTVGELPIIATIATLKAIVSNDKILRWVEEVYSWYQHDPASTAPVDGLNVIIPDSGIGRWFRQTARAALNSLPSVQVNQAGPVAAALNTRYFVRSSNGIVSFDLSSLSPQIGDVIEINHLSSSLANLTQVSGVIDGFAPGVEAYLEDTQIRLSYAGLPHGWIVWSSQRVRAIAAGVQTFTYASDGDTNGFFYWLGTNQGLATFVNPALVNGIVGPKVVAMHGGFVNANNLLDRAASELSINESTNNIGLGGLAFYFSLATNQIREFRLSQLLLRNPVSSLGASRAIRSFRVDGLPVYNPNHHNLIATDRTEFFRYANLSNWQTIKVFENDLRMSVLENAYALYPIDSPDYFYAYRIQLTGPSAAATYFLVLGEVEFYGDVRFS